MLLKLFEIIGDFFYANLLESLDWKFVSYFIDLKIQFIIKICLLGMYFKKTSFLSNSNIYACLTIKNGKEQQFKVSRYNVYILMHIVYVILITLMYRPSNMISRLS